jgi:Cell division protein FtsI/penicillin-binding protein 2
MVEKLAASLMVDSVCANPLRINNPREVSSRLSSVLNTDNRRSILRKLSKSGSFCWLARRVSPACADDVSTLNIDGIYLTKELKRFYPNSELAGQLLGFAGFDSTGLEGLELKYDGYLRETGKVFMGKGCKGKENLPAGKYNRGKSG